MNKGAMTGAILATAVALAFVSATAYAEGSSTPSGKAPQVKCVGGNSCKGKSACMSASNDCKGQNACKGKGYVMLSSAGECTKAGGHPATAAK